MKLTRVSVAPTLALVVALGLPSLGTTAPKPSASARAALARAINAVGGEDALRDFRSFSLRSTGVRRIFDESFNPGDAPSPSATFDLHTRYARGVGPRRTRMRLDFLRRSAGAERPVSEVIAGRAGFISGVDANFSAPATKPMTSDRWAAIRKEQLLLNPQLLLRQALTGRRSVSDGGRFRAGGRVFRRVVLDDQVAPITLFVDTATGRLARLETMQHDYLRRDVAIVVSFFKWRRAGGGLLFPMRVRLTEDGSPILNEQRSVVAANRTFSRRVFRFPAGIESSFDRGLSVRGAKTSEWLVSFANLGFIKDGRQSTVDPERVAPGVFLIGGAVNNSMVVRRSNGVLVVEGALHEMRTRAVVDWIHQRFPGARITHIVNTHYHADHSGGMRSYVARGATAVVHEAAVPFFRQVFAERDSTILPDGLDGSTRTARIRAVPAGGHIELRDPLRTVEVYPVVNNTHSADSVIVFVREGGAVFVSDIYTPGGTPGQGGIDLNNTIVNNGLDVQTIVGGHGGTISYQDFLADLNGG